jgi:beta-hydroxyacyl-ACP dehydratase FabZ
MAEPVYDIRKIMSLLPHRYPFVLIDKVIEITDPGKPNRVGKIAVGIKNVTYNENFFPGHFPENPIMPGVLQLEAMAQLAALSFYRADDSPMEFMIASVSNARFRRPVIPGDVLKITSEIMAVKGPMIKVAVKCEVDGELVTEAEMMAHAVPKKDRSV